MERARAAAFAALFVVLSVSGAAALTLESPPAPQAVVSWPPATLLVSEVLTGGASASDEFAEITNVGAAAVDLAGLEIAYVTSSGSTVTRKASWPTTVLLEPGRHLLIANTAGMYASLADATYSGGFAATGGSIVLRAIGGAPVDAVGWGDATNTFVEASPAPAPAAGSSVERKPGGIGGNTIDTNDNAADWSVQANPNPQSLAAPPVPAPGATPTLEPSAPAATAGPPTTEPTIQPSSAPTESPIATTAPTPSLDPTPAPTTPPSPTLDPSASPAASATPMAAPTQEPTLEPTSAPAPTPTPSPTPTADPTTAPTTQPTPSQLPAVSIVDARGRADGTTVRIVGVLTTRLGALEDGRKAFVQDDTGGIAIYLDVEVPHGLPADTQITVTGTLDDRFAERTLRANLADVISLGEMQRPQPWQRQTGAIDEAVEGHRVIVQGVTVGPPTDMADGVGLMVDDGTGPVRVIVGPEAGGGVLVPSGTTVVAIGPVGQRDSGGTGLSGYRIHATEQSDFGVIAPPPTPTPVPTATPTPSPTAAPTPSPQPTPAPGGSPTIAPTPGPTATPGATRSPPPGATPSPSPRPSQTPGPTAPPVISIVEARGASVGTVVTVAGVVTAEAGRLGVPPLIAIADGTGGIAVRLREGASPPSRGTTVLVRGMLADPYGQLELRPRDDGFRVTGRGSLPAPVRLAGSALGEATEGRLAEITGTVAATPRKGSNGDLTIDVADAAGTQIRVVSDGSSGIGPADLIKGRTYRLTGIVGQRASRRGALDGYRIHLRDQADVALVAGSGGPGASGAPPSVVPVATARAMPDGTTVTIDATVTAGVTLLDSSGRRIVVQDASGAIEVLLPSGASGPAVGKRLRITGTTGRAWGAPRIGAVHVVSIPGDGNVTPKALARPPAERDEWLLVRLSGSIHRVERLGDRWRAEIVLADRSKAAVHGQAGAGIPSTAIVVGRRIIVVGIVKRPYPTANDRRFAVLPRSRTDVSIAPAGDDPGSGAGSGSQGGGPFGGAGASPGPGVPSGVVVTPDTDLATLSEHVGERVRVGGLIEQVATTGFDLDDGTALARIELRGAMAALLPHLRRGEAVAATGRVELVDGAPVVVVDADGTLVRVGSLGQALPIGDPGAESSPAASPGTGAAPITADTGGLGPDLAPTSLVALAGLTLASALMTLLRRRLVQRRLRAAAVERLESLREHGSNVA